MGQAKLKKKAASTAFADMIMNPIHSAVEQSLDNSPRSSADRISAGGIIIHTPDADKRPSVKQNDPFWIKWTWENRKLIKRYPMLTATKGMSGDEPGVWVIKGGPAIAKQLYRDLAIQAAKHIGCQEGPEGCVQYWIDEVMGYHIVQAKLPEVKMDEIDLLTENSDGRNEFHMGRQKHAGGHNRTDSFDKPKAVPMEVPRVITPSGD